MASRNMLKINADWSKISSRVTKHEVPKMLKLKSQIDGCVTKASALPDSLPKINWAHYKASASDPKIVEEIENKYNSLKISAPKPKQSCMEELAKAKDQDMARLKRFTTIAEGYIEASGVIRKKFEDMIPVPEMTMEDWTLTFPDWSTTQENPSLYPHLGRTVGLSREEAAAFEKPDAVPYATKSAWTHWEKRKKHYE